MVERNMTSRILSAGAVSVALAGSVAFSLPAGAATPADVLVVAQSIDDIVSFDPAQGYELTTVQTYNNVYQRLVQTNPTDGTKLDGAPAESWVPAAALFQRAREN
jgi:peptide/nickel transport system substrate-binding protein